jgi:CheY-like chemotaxis protein
VLFRVTPRRAQVNRGKWSAALDLSEIRGGADHNTSEAPLTYPEASVVDLYTPEVDALPSGRHVLVVEDDDQARALLEGVLSSRGDTVTAVRTAEDGLDRMRVDAFDLVIADHGLPGRSGLWMLQRASEQGLMQDAVAVIITGQDSLDGAVAYPVVTKPFDIDVFIREADDLLATRPSTGRQSQKGRSTAVARNAGRIQRTDAHRIELVLYVSSLSVGSIRALEAVRDVISRTRDGEIKFSVCDLAKQPQRAADDRITYTPTLLKLSPGPRTWIVGQLQDPTILVDLLEEHGIRVD